MAWVTREGNKEKGKRNRRGAKIEESFPSWRSLKESLNAEEGVDCFL